MTFSKIHFSIKYLLLDVIKKDVKTPSAPIHKIVWHLYIGGGTSDAVYIKK